MTQGVKIRYTAVEACLVHGKLFKAGEHLLPHWVPKPEGKGKNKKFPKWFSHFEPDDDAQITIMAKRNIELGIDPAKDKKIRARAAALRMAADNVEDHTEPEAKVDFLYLTDEDAEGVSKDALVDGLAQLGVVVKPDDYSEAELLEMGRDAALSGDKDKE